MCHVLLTDLVYKKLEKKTLARLQIQGPEQKNGTPVSRSPTLFNWAYTVGVKANRFISVVWFGRYFNLTRGLI